MDKETRTRFLGDVEKVRFCSQALAWTSSSPAPSHARPWIGWTNDISHVQSSEGEYSTNEARIVVAAPAQAQARQGSGVVGPLAGVLPRGARRGTRRPPPAIPHRTGSCTETLTHKPNPPAMPARMNQRRLAFSFSGAVAAALERSSTLAIARASARPRSSGAPGQNPVMKGKRETRPTDTREAEREPKHFAARIADPNRIIPHK